MDPLRREVLQGFGVRFEYPVVFTRDAFAPRNTELRRILLRGGPGRHRLLAVIDSGLLTARPDLAAALERFAARHADLCELVSPPLVVRGGETCKNDPLEVSEIHAAVAKHRICRQSFILAIGGGAVLDAVGFAAATAHRGVRLIRMPSTVLAQNDAGVGVKNAINAGGRKNFVGCFAPPFAVLNDLALLESLEARDRRSGMAEAVKVALIKDRRFFEWLEERAARLARFEASCVERLVARCAELHLEHIRSAGDPFELGSARPLDFGHWAAHRLEELSDGALRHGEAVAIGIGIDALYSQRVGMLDADAVRRIRALLGELGFCMATPHTARLDVPTALSAFREHLGGELCITLLAGLGAGVETHEIDEALMQECVDAFTQRT